MVECIRDNVLLISCHFTVRYPNIVVFSSFSEIHFYSTTAKKKKVRDMNLCSDAQHPHLITYVYLFSQLLINLHMLI